MSQFGIILMLFFVTNCFAQNGYWQQQVDYKMEIETLILESQTKSVDNVDLFFTLQFLSSNAQVEIDSLDMLNKDLIHTFHEKNQYKYTYGRVSTLEEIASLKKDLLKYGFDDSFTVGILNGKKISLSDALSILN